MFKPPKNKNRCPDPSSFRCWKWRFSMVDVRSRCNSFRWQGTAAVVHRFAVRGVGVVVVLANGCLHRPQLNQHESLTEQQRCVPWSVLSLRSCLNRLCLRPQA